MSSDCWIRNPDRVTAILNQMFNKHICFKCSVPLQDAPKVINGCEFEKYYVIVSFSNEHFELLTHNSDGWAKFRNFCSNPCNNLAVNGRVVTSVRIYYES